MKREPRSTMVLEIVTSMALLFVGLAVLIMIHICVAGRTFVMTRESIESSTVVQRSSTMSDDDIKRLSWYDYKLDQEDHDDDDDDPEEMKRDKCAVCLEGFKCGDKCRLLPNCRHSFHVNCIDSWLLKNAVCPVCRTCVDLGSTESGSRSLNDVSLELT